MRHFITLLSIALVIAACDVSDSGSDDFQGKRIGNWMTTSETSLKWVGSPSMAKLAKGPGDSTFYAAPNGNDLVVYYTGDESGDRFLITYRDSSYSFAVFDTTAADATVRFIDPFDKKANNGFIGATDDYMETGITVTSFDCDSTYNLAPEDDFAFEILSDTSGVYETIVVDTDGVVEAVRQIGC